MCEKCLFVSRSKESRRVYDVSDFDCLPSLSLHSLSLHSLPCHLPFLTRNRCNVSEPPSLGDDMIIPSIPHLHTLTLNKNKIGDLEGFLTQVKNSCPRLSYLSLLFNAACPNELVGKDDEDYRRYRYLVLNALPNLKFLDSNAVTAEVRWASRIRD